MATVVAPKTAANTCSKSRAPVAKRVPLQPCYSAGRHHRCGRRAPNYAEARGAESRADFVHKMRIIQKELNETSVWLRVIMRCWLLSPELIVAIIAVNNELSRIVTASIRTARSNISAAPSDEN